MHAFRAAGQLVGQGERALGSRGTGGSLGTFSTLNGTILRASVPKLQEASRTFSCAKCMGRVTRTDTARCEEGILCGWWGSHWKPNACTRRLEDGTPCGHTVFKELLAPERDDAALACRDYQEAKLQENIESLPIGTVRRARTRSPLCTGAGRTPDSADNGGHPVR